MENYILQILESNSRVIVPEFGAFIVKQRNPFTIVFNEFLQYNDGVLVDTISKSENISREDAKIKVDDFIKRINDTLARGESFSIGRLGNITKGSSGKISLEKADESSKPEKPKANEKSAAEIAKKKSVVTKKKAESRSVIVMEPEQVTTEVVPPHYKDIPTETDKSEMAEVIVESKAIRKEDITQIVEHTSEEIKSPAMKDEKTETPKPKPANRPVTPVTMKETKPGREYKRSNIVTWVIIIFVVNILLIGYFIYSDELNGLFAVRNQDTLVTEPVFEEITPVVPMEESTTTEEASDQIKPEDYTPPAEEPTVSVITGTRYYVVAGVFREEQNAIKLVEELRKKGFNAERFGKIGELHAVSYDVFSTKNQADKYLDKIQQQTDPEAWIRAVK